MQKNISCRRNSASGWLATAILAAVSAALPAFLPFSTLADDSTGTIVKTITSGETDAILGYLPAGGGDVINIIKNADGTFDVAHIFTNTTSGAEFTVSDTTLIKLDSGRILVVGGGGAGGGDCGGGGGGGGVVYEQGLTLASGANAVEVGGGAQESEKSGVGGSGKNTVFTLNGTTYTALGGGGGGSWSSDGSKRPTSGGSGGGGGGNVSQEPAAATQPSSVSGGYGNSGGTANYDCGGGGGGAAGVGGDSVSAPANKSGDGGAGFGTDITGVTVYYGAGGGGGGVGISGAGGSGVGGNGSQGSNSGPRGNPGKAGTGSGGGGGPGGGSNNNRYGGAGGSGIVVIRYTLEAAEISNLYDGSILYTFKTSKLFDLLDDAQPFRLPEPALVRVLAVGGGGAGGSGTANLTQGGNGGGGAGRFIEVTNVWQAATYTVTVGAGGSASTSAATALVTGDPGKPTIISANGTDLIYMPGGGGGAAAQGGSGSSGGSGGGGSNKGSAGSAIVTYGGLGNNGGNATYNRNGAGGGGAGSIGKSPSGTGATAAGAGGDPVPSDITGSTLYYAAGGGGGYRVGTGGKGGAGADNVIIGGTGGSDAETSKGKDGTGSGGGGGSNSNVGGAGGSGIVHIRVIRYMPVAPEAAYGIEFDGAEHRYFGLVAPDAASPEWKDSEADEGCPYTITLDSINGTPVGLQTNAVVATAVGVYSYTVALKAEYKTLGYVWSDFSDADRTVVVTISRKALTDVKLHVEGWQIGEDPFQPVLTANMTLADESSEGAMNGDYYLRYSSDGSNWKTFTEWYVPSIAPGKYYVKATIRTDSPNFEWTGENPVEEFKLWEYVIGKYPDYLGYHSDVDVSSTSAADGARLVLVRISEGVPFGFSYDKAQPDGSDIRFTYKDITSGDIVLLPYELEGGWNAAGETLAWVSVPAGVTEITMNWGVLEDTEIPESPDASGIWDGVQRFPALEYARAYHAEIVVTNALGTTIADYPMALVLSNGSPNGFSFETASADGSDLAFSLADGTLLAYEIETWNNNGKSLVWVKVPEYKNGATFYMHWGVKRDGSGNEIAVANPESSEVWSAYAGVWHMTGAKDSASGAPTGTLGNKTTAVNGIFGGALSASEQGEPLILATASENVNSVASGSFTVSFYTKYNATSRGTAAQYLFSRRQALGYAGYALCINSPLTSTATQFIDCFGEAAGRFTLNDSTPMTRSGAGKWVRNDIVYTSNRFYWYVNGEELYWTRDMSSGFSNGTTGLLGIGGLAATGSDSNINGAIDEFRIYAGTPDATLIAADTNQWKLVESGTATFVSTASVVVSPDPSDVLSPTVTTPESKFVNRWVTLPSVAPLEWTLGYVPSISRGSAAYGTATYVFKTLDGTELESETLPDAVGTYTVTFKVPAADFGTCSYGELVYTLPDAVTITAKNEGGGDLSGTAGSQTLSGRVLLANDDNIDGHEVSLQSYWQTNAAEDVYWVHGEDESYFDGIGFPLLGKGVESTLTAKEPLDELCGATKIWHLKDVRIGDVHPLDLSEPEDQCFLPYSSSAKVLREDGTGYIAGDGVQNSANLVMRNSADAAIYSPCYTNGIGTIYFDAVNSWRVLTSTVDGFALVVEVATNCVDSSGEDAIPTDENMSSLGADENESIVKTINYESAAWIPLEMTAFFYDGSKFNASRVRLDDDDRKVYLDATEAEAGGHDKFFRVIVPVSRRLGGYRGPARFRIRRVELAGENKDQDNYILVDNIVVSYPAMTANLGPHGEFDPDKGGKMVLGQECAFDVPFPSVADAVTPRGKVSYETNPLQADPETSKFVYSATMHYRWRYLNQMLGDWKSVAISPSTFNAISAMDFGEYNGMPGDVEFWYELRQMAPYYTYVDYSGMGLNFDGIYSEDIPVVTNRASGATFESQGTDWFVRLREGKSDYEAIEVVIGPEDADALSVVEMEVTGPHSWRGFFPTPTNLTGNLKFQVRARNRQEAGATEVVTNVVYMRGMAEDRLPISVKMSKCAEGEATVLTNFTNEAKTGYLMFMIDDNSSSLSVVRANYQNFNHWSDAMQDNFVGTEKEGARKSGTSPSKIKISEQFTSGWTPMPATTNDWTVPYVGWTYVGNMLGRSANTPFTSDTSGIWQVGPGMWVPKLYDDRRANMGVALQMQGQGYGYLQLTDSNMLPRGYGELSFNARVAQDIAFSDFSYYDGGGYKKLTNYTFTARVAFDFNSCKDFRGNAALSLVAYYQPNVGCYEYRIEPVEANSTTDPSGIQTKNSLRMSLYKWSVDTVTGGIKPKLLGSYTNNFTIATIAKTQETSNNKNYIPMYISVSNDVNGVACIMAGVGRSGADYSSELYVKTKGRHYHLCYRDTKAPHIRGSYGCLATNSKGVFQRPIFYDKPIGFLTNFTTNDRIDCYSEDTDANAISYLGNAISCKQSLIDDDWTTQYGRMTPYLDKTNGDFWGVRATEETIAQTLTVYTVPVDEVSSASKSESWNWTAVTNITVSGFGTDKGVANYRVPLYVTKDSYMKIAVDGNLTDVRRDIVIDSLSVTSWRGASWNDDTSDLLDYTPYSPSEAANVYTNFSYFSAWVTNAPSNKAKQALLLSAKRTARGTVCGIKSPLMDGGSTSVRRGSGLGMISFRYENGHPAVKLKVQIATNDVGTANFTQLNTVDNPKWQDWGEPLSCSGSGVRSVYIGLHGVKGAVRIIMDPEVVNQAESSPDPKYGEIFITSISCTDEPNLDEYSWWGWNLRAVGSDKNTGMDKEGRMYLPDMSVDPERTGMSMALNNSVDEDINEEEAEAYKVYKPFVQTPTIKVDKLGEVMFRARRYGYTDKATDDRSAYVTLYGATTATAESDSWKKLQEFEVTNKTFTTYSYRVEPGSGYAVFRLAVTGVKGLTDPDPGAVGGGYDTPVRVLLDEVMVSEAVLPGVRFRSVGAFRGNPKTRENIMRDLLIVPGVPSEFEQPLCDEAWGVQCEIYKDMLPDELDLETRRPEVYLHYFKGPSPWGFENWRSNSLAKVCRLDLAEDSTEDNLVYRSSYTNGVETVLPVVPSSEPLRNRIYQYCLEVVYYRAGSSTPMTNTLDLAQWGGNPPWYRGIDYNNQYGGGKAENFSAYCVFDTIAPGWAWINEVNIYGSQGTSTTNLERDRQFVELAVPSEADISGWKFRMLWSDHGNNSVITNTAAVFGSGPNQIPGTKKGLEGQAQNMVFRTIGNPQSKATGELVDYGGEKETLDGTWSWNYDENPDIASQLAYDESIATMTPIGFQLVRPSGIIEHEIVAIGLDWWADTTYYTYHPTNTVNYLNQKMSSSRFFYVGSDEGGLGCSLNVFDSRGESESVWTNAWVLTPGRINRDGSGNVQEIDPDHPFPNGDTVIVYCTLDTETSGDRLMQSIKGADPTNMTQIVYLRKGIEEGLEITYTANPWFELASVVTNSTGGASGSVPFEAVPGEVRKWKVTVGVNASNSFTVVASPVLLSGMGIDPSDRYYGAMVKWLADQRHADGTGWKNPGSDTIYPVQFCRMAGKMSAGEVVTNLDVRTMYWLDLDPTDGPNAAVEGEDVNNVKMVGGASLIEAQKFRNHGTLTNRVVGVHIMFTNEAENVAWAPNVLRGLAPDETSWNTPSGSWTSETFKVTGIIWNGRTSMGDSDCWVPLRWFVFKPDSFDGNFTSKIEIVDPYSPSSVGYPQWKRSLGEQWSYIYHSWWLDDRGSNFDVEELKETNYYNYNE